MILDATATNREHWPPAMRKADALARQWEADGRLQPEPDIPQAELADLYRLLAYYELHGGPGFYHLQGRQSWPLLAALQRAVRELGLSPAEFGAIAQAGRHLENLFTGPLPTLRPYLRARWGARVDEVWPPSVYAEEQPEP